MAKTLCIVAIALMGLAACCAQNVPVNPMGNSGACQFDNVRDSIAFALRNRDEFDTFRRMVAAADLGLTNRRATEAKLTVFAPNNGEINAAFDGDDDVEDVITNPARRAELNEFVRTHITNSGAFSSKALRDNQVLQMLQPNTQVTVNVDRDTGRPLITLRGPSNTARITDPRNIKACKSFIHAIDEALESA